MLHPTIWATKLLCLLLAATALVCFGQFSASVNGTILDPTQAIIGTAKVELKNVGTGVVQSTTVTESGVYRFTSLPPGEYEIKAEASGFTPKTVTLNLTTGQTAGVNHGAG